MRTVVYYYIYRVTNWIPEFLLVPWTTDAVDRYQRVAPYVPGTLYQSTIDSIDVASC